VHFDETSKDKFIPRSLVVDFDPSHIDKVKSGPLGKLLSPDSFLQGTKSAQNNWGIGHYTEGPNMIHDVFERIQKLSEACDSL
jgi:hypothetical protein